MNSVLTWLGQTLTSLWTAFLKFGSACLQILIDLVSMVVNLAVDLVFLIIVFAVSLLPPVPDLPSGGTLNTGLFALANYFFPFDTLLQLVAVLALVYAAVWLYKLGKFVRGGG